MPASSADERFDVTPYAEGLTRFLLRHRLSSTLPRKFKIAFEGCGEDHVATAINDLGFHAELDADGTRGFRVAGRRRHRDHVQVGRRHPRVPAGVGDSAGRRSGPARVQAVRRLRAQAAQPDEVHDQGARLGALEGRVPTARSRHAEADAVPLLEIDPPAGEAAPNWPHDEAPSPNLIASRVAAAPPSGPGITPTLVPVYMPGDEAYARWRATNVRPQKQFGYVMATATVPLGDLTSEQMRVRRRAGARLQRRHRARDGRSESGLPLGQRRRPARAVSPAVRGQPRPRRSVDRRRRRQLSGRRVVPAGRHAVARARPAARGASARASRSDRRRRRRAHQDQRLPERLRPASHRDDRLPGQRAAGRRAGRCRSTS